MLINPNMPINPKTLKHDGIKVAIWSVAILVAVLPIMMLGSIITDGLPHVSWSFLLSEPSDAGRQGGIFPLLIATLWILVICLLTVIPIGLGCALYLSECVAIDNPYARIIGASLDVLSGVPSIVFGLFGYAVFAIQFGLGFSILSGGLSLACMVLPLFIRTTEQALRSCPTSYRQAAEALNLTLSGFVLRILLPASAAGIAAALVISTGRALAETAVLIFTAGYVTRMPEQWTDSGRALSVHIYDLSMNVPGGQDNAAATAVVLITLIVIINIITRRLSLHWQTPV